MKRTWRPSLIQLGVPHIEAQTAEGLAYRTGYAGAEDRLSLTDAIRCRTRRTRTG